MNLSQPFLSPAAYKCSPLIGMNRYALLWVLLTRDSFTGIKKKVSNVIHTGMWVIRLIIKAYFSSYFKFILFTIYNIFILLTVNAHVRYKYIVCCFCNWWWHTHNFLSCPFRDSLLPHLSQENAFLDYQELLGRYLGRIWILPTIQRGWDMWDWSNADLRCRLILFCR